MPAIEGSIDPSQEDTLQEVLANAIFHMQTRYVAFQEVTSCGLEKLFK